MEVQRRWRPLDGLVQFLRDRLDEDELWATEASRDDGKEAPKGGVHWRWVASSNDEEIVPDPGRGRSLVRKQRRRPDQRRRARPLMSPEDRKH